MEFRYTLGPFDIFAHWGLCIPFLTPMHMQIPN